MKITDRIHALKIPFQITDPSGQRIPRFVYCYLIYGKKIALIDSAVASSERIILDYLNKTGHGPEEISEIILTHSHPDHIGAAKSIKSLSGSRIAAHAAEKAWIEDVKLQERERPVPSFRSLVAGSVHIDRILEDSDLVDLGGISLEVIHTPGHSPGSISLWCAEEKALFSADAIPIPGEMPIYQDITESVRSIQRLKGIAGIKQLLSAWDEPRSGSDAYPAMDRGLEYLEEIHHAVLRVLGEMGSPSLDPMELCRKVVAEMELSPSMINPLVAGSFMSSLPANKKFP